jgi:hypothetical protein
MGLRVGHAPTAQELQDPPEPVGVVVPPGELAPVLQDQRHHGALEQGVADGSGGGALGIGLVLVVDQVARLVELAGRGVALRW